MVLDGQDITGQPGHISYMLQKDLLLPYKKIIDNVSLPLLLSGKSKKEARTEAGSHFAQFGLEGTQQQYPGGIGPAVCASGQPCCAPTWPVTA